jgi:hypothetical protein
MNGGSSGRFCMSGVEARETGVNVPYVRSDVLCHSAAVDLP